MKTTKFIQYKTLSTGYIHGSIPPQFSENKEIIDLIGSDGVSLLDNRYNLKTCINAAKNRIEKHIKKSCIVGFEINFGTFSNYKTLYKNY